MMKAGIVDAVLHHQAYAEDGGQPGLDVICISLLNIIQSEAFGEIISGFLFHLANLFLLIVG